MDNSEKINQAASALKKAQHIFVLTGAGVSAESGIPTFRDKQTGLWENYCAEDLANIKAFQRNPEIVWQWYQWRRTQIENKTPNFAHHALNDLQTWAETQNKTLTLVTQNVDDLHEQAGSIITHLHGELWRNKCSQCNQTYEKKVATTHVHLLHCSKCDGIIRPDVVWFGEPLPQDAWQRAELEACKCDIFFSIGTSSLVYPAASLSQMAKKNSSTIVEINPNPTHSPHMDIIINQKAGLALPELIKKLT